mmetsp:Transcript_5905/g.14551  ORF Transcript_5905/g.14551 Transcript_5905/m.14551 type:complete len:214 (+) Transcript_5905:3936-4577(+)
MLVDGTRHQLLAGAGLTLHQHRRHAARHLVDQGPHGLNGRRLAHQPQRGGRRRRGHHTVHHRRWRRCRHRAPQGRANDQAELAQVHRFGQVVVGPGLQRLDRVFRRAEGRDHQGLLRPPGLLQPAQQCQARAVGQLHVGDDGAVATGLQMRQRLGDGAGAVDLITLTQQGQLIERPQVGFIVDNEEAGSSHGGAMGRRRRTQNALASAATERR